MFVEYDLVHLVRRRSRRKRSCVRPVVVSQFVRRCADVERLWKSRVKARWIFDCISARLSAERSVTMRGDRALELGEIACCICGP
jgi:hypothetical protein